MLKIKQQSLAMTVGKYHQSIFELDGKKSLNKYKYKKFFLGKKSVVTTKIFNQLRKRTTN